MFDKKGENQIGGSDLIMVFQALNCNVSQAEMTEYLEVSILCTCMYARVHVCVHACIHVSMYPCTRACVHMCHVCMCAYQTFVYGSCVHVHVFRFGPSNFCVWFMCSCARI